MVKMKKGKVTLERYGAYQGKILITILAGKKIYHYCPIPD